MLNTCSRLLRGSYARISRGCCWSNSRGWICYRGLNPIRQGSTKTHHHRTFDAGSKNTAPLNGPDLAIVERGRFARRPRYFSDFAFQFLRCQPLAKGHIGVSSSNITPSSRHSSVFQLLRPQFASGVGVPRRALVASLVLVPGWFLRRRRIKRIWLAKAANSTDGGATLLD